MNIVKKILSVSVLLIIALGLAKAIYDREHHTDPSSSNIPVFVESEILAEKATPPELTNETASTASSNPATVSDDLSGTNYLEPILVLGYINTESGALPAQSKIKLQSSSLQKWYFATSTGTGHFQFENVLPASDYRVTVVPKGMFHRYYEENLHIHAGRSQLLITLDTLAADVLNGLVEDINGEPVPDFKLNIRSKTKTLWNRDVVTNSIGQFHLNNVPVGELDLSSMSGQVLFSKGHYFYGADQSQFKLVVDSGSYEVSGLVFNQYNEPIPGANVIFGWKTSTSVTTTASYRRTITNPGGFFSLKGIGPGKHDLVVSDSTGATYRQTMDIVNGVTNVTILLTNNPLSQ